MEYRKSQWSENISSLLRKTEMNLIRIQTPYHEEVPRTYASMTYNTSFYDNQMIQEPPHRPPTEYKDDTLPILQQEISTVKNSLEKLLHERLRGQKKDLEDINERLTSLEIGNQDMDRFKEDIQKNLYNIEKKCLAEVKRIENSGKGFITQEDLKIATEAIRNANINSLKQLEKEIEYVRSGDMDIKEEVFRITEEKVRDISKKFVTNNEFNSLKETVLKETKDRFRDFDYNLNGKIDEFRSDNSREILAFEQKISELSKKFDQKEDSIFRKIRDLEVSLEKSTKKSAEDKKRLEQELEKLSNTEEIEELSIRIRKLENQIQDFPKEIPEPDLSHFVQKKELIALNSKLQEFETYKKNVNEKIVKLEKKIDEVENRLSDSSEEIEDDIVAKQDFINKGAATFGKNEPVESGGPALTKIFINDLGDSDSESHGYISPHTSPMNQLPLSGLKLEEKKDNQQFDFKHKTNLRINQGLGMINEDPVVENKLKKSEEDNADKIKKPNEIKKVEEPGLKKTEVKHFSVETVKVEKKPTEDSLKNKGKDLLENKGKESLENSGKTKEIFVQSKKNVIIPSSDSESSGSEDMFGLKKTPLEKSKPKITGQKAQNLISLDIEDIFDSPKPNLTKQPEKNKKIIEFDEEDLDFGLGDQKKPEIPKKDEPVKTFVKAPEPTKKIEEEKKTVFDNVKNPGKNGLEPIGGKMQSGKQEFAPIGSKMAKSPEPIAKGPQKKTSEPDKNAQLNRFISDFTEEFISEHINFGCAFVSPSSGKNLLEKGKLDPPNLKIPQTVVNMKKIDLMDSSSQEEDSGSDSGSDRSFDDSFGLDVDLP
ncbi:hypothetical protein SteCoe_34449 [Stentor coeruleus]|uniref:Uncharacterized protein n=1 Tax=Stentor coeruleus TaxID=5963 RepID=A0A1R2AUH5_9CILI|nr:hypothetical protein SteCoe_34449 [Stentor coeruleus]